MAVGDLTTLANVKGYVETIDPLTPQFDGLLGRLITSCSVEFEAKIGWKLLSASYTDTFSGDGSTVHRLEQVACPGGATMPTVSVTSVTVDGVTVPQRTTVDGDGWVLDGARVRLHGYTFTRGLENVAIVYASGYAAVPADVEQAVIEEVALIFARRKSGPLNYEVNSGIVSDFRGTNEVFAHHMDTVERYRSIGVG